MGALKKQIYQWLRSRQQRRAAEQISRLGYTRLFDGRPAEAYPCVPGDMLYLYKAVRDAQPEVILEFGSGCSTIMMSQALADNAQEGKVGRLYSLDADTRWGQVTIDSMPDELVEWSDITLTEAIPSEFAGEPVWRYANIPGVVPDLIYLDGPALNKERKAAVDVLDMEMSLKPGSRLIVDGRIPNCKFLERHFQRNWRGKRNKLLKNRMYTLINIFTSGFPR